MRKVSVAFQVLILASLAFGTVNLAWAAQQTAKEREKAILRQQFTKSFRDLQITSQQLLKSHQTRQLTTAQLSKAAKTINRAAKNLRTLMALGELANEPDAINEQLQTASAFDQAIRQLAQIIYDFAHSPHHKNTKVFDTVEAAKLQKDLLTIIALSKVLEAQANRYSL